MRVLMNGEAPVSAHALTDEQMAVLYAAPALPWWRVNMVASLDGAATGNSGKTDSINNAADKRVFDLLRSQADAVVVGAGTARLEYYRPLDRPLVLVSRSGSLPPQLLDAPRGSVMMATCASADGLDLTRRALGVDNVLVFGHHGVDLGALKAQLASRGLTNVLSEGGPHLLRDLLAAGTANELCATMVPRVVGGDHTRIVAGPPVDLHLELRVLLEEDGSLIGRWFT